MRISVLQFHTNIDLGSHEMDWESVFVVNRHDPSIDLTPGTKSVEWAENVKRITDGNGIPPSRNAGPRNPYGFLSYAASCATVRGVRIEISE